MNSSIQSHSMAVDRVPPARRPVSFASQLALDIHVLTADVGTQGLDRAAEIDAAE
jgi:hypothetical protein